MGKKISAAAQQKAAEELAEAMSSFDGVSADIDSLEWNTSSPYSNCNLHSRIMEATSRGTRIGIFCRLLLNDYGNSLAGSGR